MKGIFSRDMFIIPILIGVLVCGVGITVHLIGSAISREVSVEDLVTEAVMKDFHGISPKNVQVIWRHTTDPNEIVVFGQFESNKIEHSFSTRVLKYNFGWTVDCINTNSPHYRTLTRFIKTDEEKKNDE